jgi:hypothetical protein
VGRASSNARRFCRRWIAAPAMRRSPEALTARARARLFVERRCQVAEHKAALGPVYGRAADKPCWSRRPVRARPLGARVGPRSEIDVLAAQCLDRRIDSIEQLTAETTAWEQQRNVAGPRIKCPDKLRSHSKSQNHCAALLGPRICKSSCKFRRSSCRLTESPEPAGKGPRRNCK